MNIEVILSPAELPSLAKRDLSKTVCVVFDVLRATTSMVTALANGAKGIIPVSEIPEAMTIKQRQPDVLLAGERHGLRITAKQSGGLDFDLGNSPREFTRDKVAGKTIATTTTNGTRALRSCAHAKFVLACTFANLGATAEFIVGLDAGELLVICAGTFEEAAYEDILCAGALCDLLWTHFDSGEVADSAQVARQIFLSAKSDLRGAVQTHSKNARRLLANPELRDDVEFCLRRDTNGVVAQMFADGIIQQVK